MIKNILDTINESSRKAAVAKRTQMPVFPIGSVLFPGGTLVLKVFEQRYMNMVKSALKSGVPFGIVLINNGAEVGAPATPEPVGTVAGIDSWDMRQLGVLHISVIGGRRFRIGATRVDSHGLVVADVEDIPDDAPALSRSMPVCATFLARVFAAKGIDVNDEKLLFDDAFWVGMRLTELLPLGNTIKQKMLELTDAGIRLSLLEKYLTDHGLVG